MRSIRGLFFLFIAIICSISIGRLKAAKYTPYDTLQLFSSYSDTLYYIVDSDAESTINNIITKWITTGEVPSHLLIEPYLQSVGELVRDSISHIERLKMVVLDTTEVTWREFPRLKTVGSFSYPNLSRYSNSEYDFVFSPYRAGYRFSPDITSFNHDNRDKVRAFSAIPLDIDYNLLPFSMDENSEKYNYRDIGFVNSEKGDALQFNGESSFVDCGSHLEYELDKEITISLWLKISDSSGYRSILGKGSSFSLKLYNGEPTFTIVRHLDYVAKGCKLPINRWTHLVVSFLPERYINFYIDGELRKTMKCDQRVVSNTNSVIIGSNFASETLCGEIADLKIWRRELSMHEVGQIFRGETSSYYIASRYKITISVVLILLIMALLYLYRRGKQSRSNGIEQISDIDSQKSMANSKSSISNNSLESDNKLSEDNLNRERKNSITSLGRFRVWSRSGEEISHKFSPQIRTIFTLFILHSTDSIGGITTERFTSYIWNTENSQRVKGARGAAVKKLRDILCELDGIELLYKNRRWYMEITEECYCDYIYLQRLLIESSDSSDTIYEINEILKRGRLSLNVSDEWYDNLHSKFVDQILSYCERHIEKSVSSRDYKECVVLADIIFTHDLLSEYALKVKIFSLVEDGQHRTAKRLYDRFCRDYLKLYGESYSIEYQTLISRGMLDGNPFNNQG